ncbi:MAG: zinc-ribbon domain-containing protein [Clostridia bacterium]|nr:zinc-ribbon domain-containing protein [Clostridia bacterium]
MFCEKCGSKLPDEAEFCTNCGASISGGNSKKVEKIEDDQIQLTVKLTFSLGYYVLINVITLVIFGIILLLYCGDIRVDSVWVLISEGILFFGSALIFGIIAPIIKKQYDSYTYDFYKTKVIYKDSFLNVSEKEVKYKYIREVTMRQTFIQKFFNLGNIVLFTNPETGKGRGNGILIKNVENVQDIYKNIKAIIDV